MPFVGASQLSQPIPVGVDSRDWSLLKRPNSQSRRDCGFFGSALLKNLVGLCFIHAESVLHEMSHKVPSLSSYCLKDAFSLAIGISCLLSLLFLISAHQDLLSLIYLFKVPKFWFHFLYCFLFSISLISIFSISSFYLLWIKFFSSLSSFYYIFFYQLYCFIYIIKYLFNLKFIFYMRWEGLTVLSITLLTPLYPSPSLPSVTLLSDILTFIYIFNSVNNFFQSFDNVIISITKHLFK